MKFKFCFLLVMLFFVCSCTEECFEGNCGSIDIDHDVSVISVKTNCSNPTSGLYFNNKVYVVCSGDYSYDDSYNYLGQINSGIEVYNENLVLESYLSSNSTNDYGAITLGGGLYSGYLYVGSTNTGRLWSIHNNELLEMSGFNGSVLPYCFDGGCLFLEQNTGKVLNRTELGDSEFNLTNFEIEYPWYVSPLVVDSSIFVLDSASGVFSKYDFYGKNEFSFSINSQYPNDMEYYDGYFYVLNTQNNVIDRFSKDGEYTPSYYDFGSDVNPYNIISWNNNLYVVGYDSGYVYGMNLSNNEMKVLNLELINQPSFMFHSDNYLYVVASEYSYSGSEGSIYRFSI